ncbi:hypothetical protein Acr_27g0001750 [Actinidia rufa]|uniref:Uncharacterized protein n=1 Tax=Actinidia rufa TaxID=165716 RepID=A0A7J0H5R0_9ERIC|nr:hypothetical protein Acr_27g0001750 [Actinidia rufa]
MSSKTILGNEESEQSLPFWISDHLGGKSYIDETNQSPSFPLVLTNSPKMDTSSLTKENNVMSQAELDNLGATYSFPSRVRLRIPEDGETILSARQGEVAFYEAAFLAGEAREELALRISEQRKGVEEEGKAANKLPALSEVDAKRTETIFGKIEPGGYFEVLKVLVAETTRPRVMMVSSVLAKIRLNTWESLDGISEGRSGEPACSDSGSDSISDSELPPELRSDAMSARVGAPALGEKTGGKAKVEKAVKATTAKPPTKGVVIREKTGRTVEAGTSSPSGGIGFESMMSDASVARRLLTGVIPASDKKEVDQLSENDLVAKSFHALGQVVVFASSLALRSQEHLHDIDFHMARTDSAELELVKAQKRAVKAENRLAELSEEGSKPGTEVDDLKATVAELTNKVAKAKELAIEDFKASGEFKAAVTDSAATYFSEGFEFCKRQLLHQFPNLGVDVANMAMDPSFTEEEEAMKVGEDPVAGVAPDV